MVCIGLLIMFCQTAGPAPAPAVRCPPLAAYSATAQAAAAAELRRLPPGSPVAALVADYGTLRARCRAAASEAK
jgi:hypothetical protein